MNDVTTDIGVVHSFGTPSGQIIDGVLQFSIQYQVFARLVEEPIDNMEDLKVDTTTV
jgi:hypothetical protein